MSQKFIYVDTRESLVAAVARLRTRPAIALDTEFSRTRTYYPDIGLVQLYDGETCYLVDPLDLSGFDVLADLLTDKHVTKVIHACSEDLEVLQHTVGAIPAPVFDTQIAGAALGPDFAVSYQNLVERFLGISIAKEETRSDWLQRPLSAAQLEYAALDVVHLLAVYYKQCTALDAAGKSHWVAEECAGLGDEIAITLAPEQVYHKVRSSARMSSAELNRLRALCAWREQFARHTNIPRNRVVEEKVLVAIVRGDIRDKAALEDVAGMSSRQVRKYGDEILFLLSEARLVPEREFPQALDDTAAPISSDCMKRLKRVVNDRAESLAVAPELLARRRYLEQLVRSEDKSGEYCLPDSLMGWRKDVIGQFLLEALHHGA